MPDSTEDFGFFTREDGLFVIPLEAVSEAGVRADFGAWLVDREFLDADSLGFLNQALSLYWRRATELHQRSPAYWVPPRAQHLCVVYRPDWVRPYFQVFHKNSWLLYRSDLEAGTSSVEFAAFQLLFAERLGLLREILPALAANLSYFVSLPESARAAFVRGAAASTRPDAGMWRALAEAADELAKLHHVDLKPPTLALPHARVSPANGLLITQSAAALLDRLQQSMQRGAMDAIERHVAAHARPATNGPERLAQWLHSARPQVVITRPDNSVVWDPDRPAEDAELRATVEGVTESALASLMADLEVVGQRTSAFLESLVDAEALAAPAPYLTAGGLSHIHQQRRLVAYTIGGAEHGYRLQQAAPPYERLMLAARTVHEWGHLATESGWVGIPDEAVAESERLDEAIADLLDRSIAAAPAQVRDMTRVHNHELAQRSGSLGRGLVAAMRTRFEDYTANLLARRFLSDDELHTYVRNNVACHMHDYQPGEAYQQIIRHAYEVQYLPLAGIEQPLQWLASSTWFEQRFIRPGLITAADWAELAALMGRLCALVRIDESRFRIPTTRAP